MPFHIRWYLEPRIIYQQYTGELTLEEFIAGAPQIQDYYAAGTPLIHAIVDLLTLEKYPPLPQLLTHIQRNSAPPGAGWAIILVNNPLLRFSGSVLTQIGGSSFTMAGSLDEAVEFLRVRDGTLALPD
jgi:hypothetical protein